MLQIKFFGEGLAFLGSVMRRRADLRESYEKLLAISERLTNYYSHADLRKYIAPASAVNDKETAALFPPCVSPETTLMERMFPPPTAVPEGFSLMDEVMRRVGKGELSLSPSPRSGWYEYELWSLEPLLIPEQTAEAEHLQFYPRYRDYLVKLFKGTYAPRQGDTRQKLDRITHSFSYLRGLGKSIVQELLGWFDPTNYPNTKSELECRSPILRIQSIVASS